MADPTFPLTTFPVHLGLGATAHVLSAIDGTPAWYERYTADTVADGLEGRLVSMYTFDAPWGMWEMHPNGHELVLCVAGSITLHQQREGVTTTVTLTPGEAVINEPGVWHTADVEGSCTAVFVTAGVGTEVRGR